MIPGRRSVSRSDILLDAQPEGAVFSMSLRRSARIQWLPLVLVAAAVGVGVYSVSCQPKAKTAAAPNDLNVLLITTDTTRADRLNCYGFSQIDTPNIDKLAAQGAMFTQCTSAVPITLPSHTSIMTGTYPFVFDVRLNGGNAVPDASVTLAELLKKKGYLTTALVASIVLNSPYNLAQGFDIYDNVPEGGTSLDPAEQDEHRFEAQRPANEMADMAIQWLQKFGTKKKFFLWTHFYDPHYPYDPPPDLAEKYPHPYFGEIEFMDRHIGRILDELDRLGLSKNTLVVLAGDHGESLGEHGEESHIFFVYDSTLHVPLIFRLPGRIKANTIITEQVRLVDVAPTILDLLGMDVPDNINGVSLLPAIEGKTADQDLQAYSETLYPHSALTFSWLRSLRSEGWKYILAPKPELYHVDVDPGEKENLIDKFPERAAEYRTRLKDLIAESPMLDIEAGAAEITMTPEEQAKFDALGYSTSDAESLSEFTKDELAKFEPEGTDPKDRVEFIAKWTRALADAGDGKYEQAEKALRELAAEEPNIGTVHLRLGTLLSKQERYDEAIAELKEGLRIAPDSTEVNRHLGTVNHKLGNLKAAAGYLAKAIEGRPNDLSSRYEAGAILAELGYNEQALAQFVEADKLANGTNAEVKYNIGVVLAELGHEDDAVRAFEWAIRLEPTHANAHYNLGNALFRQNEFEKAVEHYQQALATKPDYTEARVNLGVSLAKLNRPDEAIEVLYEATRTDPTNPSGFARLSQLLTQMGRRKEAVDVLSSGLAAQPQNASFAVNLALLLLKSPEPELHDPQRAIDALNGVMAVWGHEEPELLRIVAGAYASSDDFENAVVTAQRALELAQAQEKAPLVEQIQKELGAYKNGTMASDSGS